MDSSLVSLAGQVLVFGFPAFEAPPALLEAASREALGGIILFKRNIESPAQVARLVASVADAAPAGAPPLVAVDQEGGRVARLGPPVLRLPPMRRLASAGDEGLTRRVAATLGRQLRALGFTMDMAPVLDVDTNPDNPIIGDRAFGADAGAVIAQALAFADGLRDAGLLACGKHFPGHGDTDLDSHLALPRLPHDRARLERVELPPFRAARGRVPSLMTAHVVFDALDPDVPATLSRRVITGLLRDELGYDGVIISDDLEMKAVCERWGVVDAGVRAIEAGCDLLLVCSDVEAGLALRDALARRAEADAPFAARLAEAAARGLALRRSCPPAPVVDAAALAAALASPEADAVAAELARRCP